MIHQPHENPSPEPDRPRPRGEARLAPGPGPAALDGRLAAARRRRHQRIRLMLAGLAAGAAWLVLAFDRFAGRLLVGLVGSLGLGVLVVLGGMGLGLAGFGLFALLDRAAGRVRRAARWPDPEEDRP